MQTHSSSIWNNTIALIESIDKYFTVYFTINMCFKILAQWVQWKLANRRIFPSWKWADTYTQLCMYIVQLYYTCRRWLLVMSEKGYGQRQLAIHCQYREAEMCIPLSWQSKCIYIYVCLCVCVYVYILYTFRKAGVLTKKGIHGQLDSRYTFVQGVCGWPCRKWKNNRDVRLKVKFRRPVIRFDLS